MIPNCKFSELVAVLDQISPVSQGAGTVSSAWVSMANFHRIAAVVNTGVLGASATLDGKLRQATDNAGTGAKDITGKALVQIVKAAGDNKTATVEVSSDELDMSNGYAFVQLQLTDAVAASLIGATLFGVHSRFMPASGLNSANVVQQVG